MNIEFMIKQILLVGIGGAVGSALRFLMSELTIRYYTQSFPLATFAINIIGCFIIGILVNSIPTNSSLKFILIAGFCGGFTTFSTFARETFDLIHNNQSVVAITYTIASCVIGVLAVWLGMYISNRVC